MELKYIFFGHAVQPMAVLRFIELSLYKLMNKFTHFIFLSRYVTQIIPLINPTHETLELQATNSNPENFVLDVNRSSVSTFGKPSNLPLLERFSILILRHHGVLSFVLLIRFQML